MLSGVGRQILSDTSVLLHRDALSLRHGNGNAQISSPFFTAPTARPVVILLGGVDFVLISQLLAGNTVRGIFLCKNQTLQGAIIIQVGIQNLLRLIFQLCYYSHNWCQRSIESIHIRKLLPFPRHLSA